MRSDPAAGGAGTGRGAPAPGAGAARAARARGAVRGDFVGVCEVACLAAYAGAADCAFGAGVEDG